MVHHPATAKRKGEGVALRIPVPRASREDFREAVPSRHEQGPQLSLREPEETCCLLCEFYPLLDGQAPGQSAGFT